MKSLVITFFVFSIGVAWPQIEGGTVVFVYFSKDEVTVAADSRTIRIPDGAQFDTECKISAFGNQFVFSLAGIAKGDDLLSIN